MTVVINGTTGITSVNGTAGAPSVTGTDTDTGIVYGTNTLSLATGGTTAVTVDSSQNVGIGTSSPTSKFQVAGDVFSTGRGSTSGYKLPDWRIYNSSTGNALVFDDYTNERMRIDSSGNLLVGTTTPAAASSNTIVGTTTSAALALAVIHNASNNSVRGLLTKAPNFSGNDGYLYIGARSTGDVSYQFTNGNWVNLNNSYGALSDIKLKENIVDATPKLEKLNQVRVVTYNLKADPSQKQIGVIAQELEQVFPSMVEESPDRDQEGNALETKTKYVKYSVFVPMLIKAIQEQQALITQLRADVEALKAAA